MSMVERVARVLCQARFLDGGVGDDGWSAASPQLRVDLLAQARAAIEAMREPTDEQRNAYWDLSFSTETFSDAAWERGIDAALKG